VAAAHLTIGSVDLDDAEAGLGEMPGESGAVGPGPLDPDHGDRAERDQEREQPPIPRWGRRERLGAQDSAERVTGGSDVDVGVGVHASDDSAGT